MGAVLVISTADVMQDCISSLWESWTAEQSAADSSWSQFCQLLQESAWQDKK